MSRLIRYWFRFSKAPVLGAGLGIGVTAFSEDDARLLLKAILPEIDQLEIVEIIAGIDISALDTEHVRPNMGNPSGRGVWFPLGYQP